MRMQNMRLSLLNDTTFEVVVDNEIIAKDFTALIPNIQAYLRGSLKNRKSDNDRSCQRSDGECTCR